MKKLLKSYIENKNVAILGFGREGKSTLAKILQVGGYKKIYILDLNDIKRAVDEVIEASKIKPEIEDIMVVCGEKYQDKLNDYDIVIKSPGIVLNSDISTYTTNITSQCEIFFERYKSQIIGITGTKGKSTTTTLIYHILESAGYEAVLGGNIGIPAFDIEETVTDKSIIVFEMSSHMLEYMKVSPHIGVLMNIHEEHLDHYGTMEKYIAAKKNIAANQSHEDICFINSHIEVKSNSEIINIYSDDISCIEGQALGIHKEKIEFKYNGSHYCYKIPADEIKLVGEHNYFDIAIAYGILKLLEVSDSDFEEGLKSYEPLPHRLQPVGNIDGVKYYDDSISTICDTTIKALESIKDVDTVLIGGMDRGIDYSELIQFLSNNTVRNIILMYKTGERILKEINNNYPEFKGKDRLHQVKDLKEAVNLAKKVTRVGKSCILSPAAASYGYFKNFEERGEEFSRLIREDDAKENTKKNNGV